MQNRAGNESLAGDMAGTANCAEGHPQANLNREWQVVASELHASSRRRCREGGEQGRRWRTICGDPGRPDMATPAAAKTAGGGPQSAVVTGPEGEEIFCDELAECG